MRFCWICCFMFLAIALAACESPDSSSTNLADAGADSELNPDSGSDPDSGVDKTEEMFASDRVIDIQIQIAKEDWNILLYEGRGLATQKSRCEDGYEYTYFDATVTIDGETIENVGIRKKGYLGSLSAIRPSIKLNFQKFIDDQYFHGMKRMTLNNDKQDPSHTHQVMSYALFRRAGVIAPRANFARVTVNGEDLGIYSHVESIKKPFIARHFNDNDGNLYEGQGADFTPERVSLLERKTNEGDGTTGPEWPYPPFEQEKQCNPPIEVSGTFHTKWYTTETFAPHVDISLNLTLKGELQTFEVIYATAGPGPESAVPATIRFLGQRADANPLMIVLVMPLSTIKKSVTQFHGMEVFGMVLEVSPTDKTTTQLGYIGNGTITLEAAGTDEGSEIVGGFAGLMSQ
jgi:CotH kinase protein